MEMNIKESSKGFIIYPTGDIDIKSSPMLKSKVLELADRGSVVLSLKHVHYINSSGLREIVDLFKILKESDKELRLCEMSVDMKELFSFTGLSKVFKIFDTEKDALGS